ERLPDHDMLKAARVDRPAEDLVEGTIDRHSCGRTVGIEAGEVPQSEFLVPHECDRVFAGMAPMPTHDIQVIVDSRGLAVGGQPRLSRGPVPYHGDRIDKGRVYRSPAGYPSDGIDVQPYRDLRHTGIEPDDIIPGLARLPDERLRRIEVAYV